MPGRSDNVPNPPIIPVGRTNGGARLLLSTPGPHPAADPARAPQQAQRPGEHLPAPDEHHVAEPDFHEGYFSVAIGLPWTIRREANRRGPLLL